MDLTYSGFSLEFSSGLTSISLLLVGCGKAYETPVYQTTITDYPTIIKTQAKTSTCTCKKKVATTTSTTNSSTILKDSTNKAETKATTSTNNVVKDTVSSKDVDSKTTKPEEKTTLSQDELSELMRQFPDN